MTTTPPAPAPGRASSPAWIRNQVWTLALLFFAAPASAQWARVAELPASDVFALSSRGDTLVAGTRVLAYLSTDAGVTWRPSTRPGPTSPSIGAALVRNGKLYVGTAGQGVFVSDDLGASWRTFNEGLVGGFLDTQLDVADLQVRGDSLYAATFGAGVYVRKLSGASTWSHFGEEFEIEQASNVFALAVGGSRVLAMAGGNGSVLFRDPGDGDWTFSLLDNRLRPGFQATSALFTGTEWVVGVRSSHGVFRSVAGQEPWTFVDLGLGLLSGSAFVTRDQHLFGAFDIVIDGQLFAVIEESDDDGATWQLREVESNAFVYKMARGGDVLFSGRADGLWRRVEGITSVGGAPSSGGLHFALVGPQPVVGGTRFHFELAQPGPATIEFFDLAGRRAADSIERSGPAGPQEISWDAHALAPGVYTARLTANDHQAALRLVRVP